MSAPAPALVSPAWLIGGLRNVPGYLGAGGGRLTFVSDTPVFDVPLAEVHDVSWPWHWFGGGVKLTAAGTKYKVTFVRPNGMPQPDPSMLQTAAGVFGLLTGTWHDISALQGLADIGTGRAAGEKWKQVLPG
ncbi:hypothetical protein ACI797_02000 [Geodermatophilus sp. SYSU D00691]